MTTQQDQFDEKLASILTAAAGVFAEKGYHNASIRDIAQATGIGLSSLYYYFQSKEELLYRIQDHAFDTLIQELERKLEGVAEPQLRLRILVDNHLRYFVENTAEMKVLSHEMNSLEGELRKALNQRKKQLTEHAMEIVLQLRSTPDLDPRIATLALFGMMNWIYHWYRPGKDVPVEILADELCRLFIGGYLNPADSVALPAGLVTGLNGANGEPLGPDSADGSERSVDVESLAAPVSR